MTMYTQQQAQAYMKIEVKNKQKNGDFRSKIGDCQGGNVQQQIQQRTGLCGRQGRCYTARR